VQWDSICVDEALADPTCVAGCEGDGGEPEPGGSDCCTPHNTPGCSDPVCEGIICGFDPFCCNTMWDSICADEASADRTCLANCA
jgi:hypothetical protein